MAEPSFLQLLPDRGVVDGGGLVRSLEPDPTARTAERPYVLVNFVATADGRAGFKGGSRALHDPGDRILFHALRERSDAVLAGTTTMAAERYGRLIPSEERRLRRLDDGRPAEPLACLVTRSGSLPLDIPLFAEPEARIALFAPDRPEIDLHGVRAHVERHVLAGPAEDALPEALRRLRQDHAVDVLLCEGGPSLFGGLLRAGAVDELFLTLVPRLAGGESGPALTSGPPLPELAGLRLRWLLSLGDALYLRYALAA